MSRHFFLPGLALLGVLGWIGTPTDPDQATPEQTAQSAAASAGLDAFQKAILAVQATLPGDSDRAACISAAATRFHVPPAQVAALASKWQSESDRKNVFSSMNQRMLGDLAAVGVSAERFVHNECLNINVGALLLSRGYVGASSASPSDSAP